MSDDSDSKENNSFPKSGSTSDSHLSENQRPDPPSSSGYVSRSLRDVPPVPPVPPSYPAPPVPPPRKQPPAPPAPKVSKASPSVSKKNVSYSVSEPDEFEFFAGNRSYSRDGLHEIDPLPSSLKRSEESTSKPRSRFRRLKNKQSDVENDETNSQFVETGLVVPEWAQPRKSDSKPVPSDVQPVRTKDPTTQLSVSQFQDSTTQISYRGLSPETSSLLLEEEEDFEKNVYRTVVEWIIVVAGAIALALIIRAFLVEAFWIPSDSMRDTLQRGDRILVDKVSYRFTDVDRGDVVVFHNPDKEDVENPELVKRVIGLPGETIEVKENQVFINGSPLENESYLADWVTTMGSEHPPTTIPDDAYFMLGDNRADSKDSRVIGVVDEDLLIGRSFVRFWPLNRIGGL